MQNRKSILAVFVLFLTLTLFFSTLPLYANSVSGSTVTEGSGNGTNGGSTRDALEEAADAARDAVDGVIDGAEDLLPDVDGSADTTIPGQNTPTPKDGVSNDIPGAATDNDMVQDDTHGDGNAMDNGGTQGTGGTLGDNDGDGMTDDSTTDGALESGFSWGWFWLILLAAVVVIVIIALCVPRRG